MKPEKLDIDPEFQSLIPPLSAEELAGLEASIKAEGCRDSIIRWDVTGKRIIVDGHNRYEICHRNGILFRTSPTEFKTRNEAKIWIIRNQFGRRNLNDAVRASLALKLKPLIEEKMKEKQIRKPDSVRQISDEQNSMNRTDEELAKVAGVSRDTIRKVEKIEASPVKELSRMTQAGEVSINAAAKVAAMPEAEQREVVAKGPEAVKEKAKEPPIQEGVPKSRGVGLDWAQKAIGMLQRIPQDDGLRKEALEHVVRWCKHNK